VRSLCLIELKRTGQRVQNALGGSVRVAALQARVIVDAYPREERDLLSAQPWNAAVAAVDG
jgi:hypothetical protein